MLTTPLYLTQQLIMSSLLAGIGIVMHLIWIIIVIIIVATGAAITGSLLG